MLPTLFKIGPLTVHSYGLMIAIGFLAAYYLIQRDFRKNGLDPQIVSNMAFWCLLLGIAGTRILHIIMFPEYYSWKDPLGWVAIWNGGLVFQGALPPVLIYLWFGLRKYHVSFWRVADIAACYLPLAQAFGRVGCFLNGCCYGVRTSLPWGIRFPRVPWDLSQPATGSPVFLDQCHQYSELSASTNHWSYPVHPTQLYGVVGLTATCLILLLLRKKWNPVQGFVLPTYLVLYGIGRIFVEFFRGDHNPTVYGFLTQQQVFSLVFIAAGIIVYVFLRRHAAAAKAPATH